MKKKVGILSLHLILCFVIAGFPIKVHALSKSSVVNSYASASEFSVYLPKSLQFDKSTKTADYQVSVEGTLADGSALHVTPDESFMLKQPGKQNIVATVQQDKTIFAAEEVNAAKKGLQTAGVITATDLSAGQWYGSFNFNVEFIKGPEKVLLTENAYDTSPIPDQYNTGCDESKLIKAKNWLVSNDTGLIWRDDNKDPATIHDIMLDFRLALKNITEDNADILIENVDFTDYVGLRTMMPNAFDKDFPVRITFKNCKMYSFASPQTFANDADIEFIFEDCTAYRISADKTEIIRCRLGGATQFRTENLAGWRALTDGSSKGIYYSISSPISAKGNMVIKDCYIYDTVDDTGDLGSSKSGKAYGIQIYQTHNITIDNCRVEIPRIPFEYSNGLPWAALYTNRANTDIVIRNSIFNGGGDNYTQVELGTDISVIGCKTPVKYYNGIHWRVPTEGEWDWSIIDSIYVTSINKEGSEIKIHATNETPGDRELRIVTNLGVTKVMIPKFVQGNDLQGEPSFKTTNIDYQVCIPSDGVEWVACFDRDSQLRFVNYSGKDAYVSENWLTD